MYRAVTPSLMHIGQPKLLTPLANGFIRHRDSTFSQELFDFTGESDGIGSWVFWLSYCLACQMEVN